jgi:hypothetical protein
MNAKALLTVVAGIVLAGCSLRGKPAKSAAVPAAPKPVTAPAPAPPPPAPLSIPQTRVELPKPQPIDPAALLTEPRPPELPEPPPAPAPARPRRTSPAAGQPASPAATAPAAATPPPETRETFQEIVSPAELKRLQDQALARRREANQILDQLSRRQLTGAEQGVAATIRNFLALSEEAEKHNDPRQANALAERAQILAKELQSGK